MRVKIRHRGEKITKKISSQGILEEGYVLDGDGGSLDGCL